MAKRKVRFGIQKIAGLYHPRIISPNGKLMLNEGVENEVDLIWTFRSMFMAVHAAGRWPDIDDIPPSKKWPKNAGPKKRK